MGPASGPGWSTAPLMSPWAGPVGSQLGDTGCERTCPELGGTARRGTGWAHSVVAGGTEWTVQLLLITNNRPWWDHGRSGWFRGPRDLGQREGGRGQEERRQAVWGPRGQEAVAHAEGQCALSPACLPQASPLGGLEEGRAGSWGALEAELLSPLTVPRGNQEVRVRPQLRDSRAPLRCPPGRFPRCWPAAWLKSCSLGLQSRIVQMDLPSGGKGRVPNLCSFALVVFVAGGGASCCVWFSFADRLFP